MNRFYMLTTDLRADNLRAKNRINKPTLRNQSTLDRYIVESMADIEHCENEPVLPYCGDYCEMVETSPVLL